MFEKQVGGGKPQFNYYREPSSDEVAKALPAGSYIFHPPGPFSPPIFSSYQANFDDLVALEGGIYEDVTNYMENFLSKTGKKWYRELGNMWRTGMILYGKPGTGKSSFVFQLMNKMIIDHNAIVIYEASPRFLAKMVDIIRENDSHKDRPIVIINEEFENNINSHESAMLNFLDGHEARSGTVFLATTNYIDEIPDRVRNRPSRFNLVREIPLPAAEHRAAILAKKLTKSATKVVDIKKLSAATEGMTIDHVKSVLTYMTVHKYNLERSVKTVAALSTCVKDYDYSRDEDEWED